jgi:insertion element IS1 protein InsB
MMTRRLAVEADAMASCVQTKTHTPWRGIAMDATTRPVMACHVGDRSRTRPSAWGPRCLTRPVSTPQATPIKTSYTQRLIPTAQHRAIGTLARKTPHIERFDHTLRQRVSRLVREALSFSKKLANHIGAIKLFICHYNLTKAPA